VGTADALRVGSARCVQIAAVTEWLDDGTQFLRAVVQFTRFKIRFTFGNTLRLSATRKYPKVKPTPLRGVP
jgi:hypothetical protein